MVALAAAFERVWRALGARQPHELVAMSLLDPARFRHPHYGRQGPATRLDSQGNWATARNPALGIPSHTCIEHTSCRTAARVAQRRIADRSPESPLRGRN